MTRWSKFPKHLLTYAVLLGVFIAPIARASGSEHTGGAPENGNRTAKVLSVRKVLREQYFLSRYPQIHYYLLYISLSISDETYCTEYETPVLDEIADVASAVNQNVVVAVKGKTVLITGTQRPQAQGPCSQGKSVLMVEHTYRRMVCRCCATSLVRIGCKS